MIDDPYAYDDDTSTWRNLALIAGIGVGGYFLWRWLSQSESGRNLGAKVREGFENVKDRVGEWTGKQQQGGGQQQGGSQDWSSGDREMAGQGAQQPGYTVDQPT